MDNFNLKQYLKRNKLLTENLELDIDEDSIEITADSGTYYGDIENGKVSFSVVYEDEEDRDGMEFDNENWKDILGSDHAFVYIFNNIPTEVEAMDDYVMITVSVEDIKTINNNE